MNEGGGAGGGDAGMTSAGSGLTGIEVGEREPMVGGDSDRTTGEKGVGKGTGSWPAGEGVGGSRTLSGGGREAANTSCGGSANSGQSDEVADRRGATAGTCGGKAWAGEGDVGGAENGWASSAARVSARAGTCRASAGAGSWGNEGVTAAGRREGSGVEGIGSSGSWADGSRGKTAMAHVATGIMTGPSRSRRKALS